MKRFHVHVASLSIVGRSRPRSASRTSDNSGHLRIAFTVTHWCLTPCHAMPVTRMAEKLRQLIGAFESERIEPVPVQLTLLWQIYSRRCLLLIHFLQCGDRCVGQAMSSRMAWRRAGKVG
jgi:hypothetical protein